MGAELTDDLHPEGQEHEIHRRRGQDTGNEQVLQGMSAASLPFSCLPQHLQWAHPETWHLRQPREAWLPVCGGGVGGEWPWASPSGAPMGCGSARSHNDGVMCLRTQPSLSSYWLMIPTHLSREGFLEGVAFDSFYSPLQL